MTSRHAKQYLKRIQQVADIEQTPLSEAAQLALQNLPDRIPAAVFNELLNAGYLAPARRGWTWTLKATHCRGKK